MNCMEFKERLPDLIGSRPEGWESSIIEHLSSCALCHEEHRRLQAGWELLKEWRDIEPSPGIQKEVLARINRIETSGKFRKPVPRRWRTAWASLGSLAAALLLIAFYLLWPSWKKETPVEESMGMIHLSEFLTMEEILEERELFSEMDLLENLDILLALDEMSEIPEKDG